MHVLRMGDRGVSSALALVALGIASACGSSSGGSNASNADAGAALAAQGCHPERAATAYVSGPTASTPAPAPASGAATACLTLTGEGGAESSLAITKDGTVFYAPAIGTDGIGVSRTRDDGATWEHVVPTLPSGTTRARVQPYMYVDPATDRLFFLTSAASGGGFDLSITSDEGATWEYASVAHDAVDWAKVYAGPPVTSQPQGYPNVVYLSAPSPISTPAPLDLSPPPDHQVVYSSLDGGKTWQSTGGTLSLKTADVPGCAASEWVIFGTAVVAADGTIYLGFRRCAHLGLGISRDEGKTWTVSDVPGADLAPFDTTMITTIIGNENVLVSEPFAVDASGNLYAIWDDAANVLRLAVSKDHAQTWSSSVVISAPTVTAVRFGAIAVKAPGTVAIAYYGTADGKKFDGFIAESTNALDPQPSFVSVTADDPATPLFTKGFDSDYIASLSGGDLIEFVQVKYAPSGDIWASFVKEMCVSDSKSSCSWDYAAHDNSLYQGAVGRLAH